MKINCKSTKIKCIASVVLMLLTFCIFNVQAKTVQRGIVNEYNEKDKKTPLPGVELDIRLAQTTASDKSGNFCLDFLTLKPGEKVNVRRIEKSGYEIFNKEALDQWNINPNEPFIIVMCRSDRLKKIRDNYEKISSQNYKNQFDKEITELERLKYNGKLKEKDYEQRLREIQENYEKQLDNLQSYVDRFSRIDLSELQPVEQKIIELVQQGKIEEAIEKYEQLDLVQKVIKTTKEIKEITKAVDKLTDIKNVKVQSRDSLLLSTENYINTLQLAGGGKNNEKILNVYRTIADTDSTNITWLLKTSNYIQEYLTEYPLALDYSVKALNLAKKQFGENHQDVANCYAHVGTIIYKLGRYDLALVYLKRALKINLRLFGEYHPNVASNYNNIGSVYYEKGDYEKALENLESAVKIRSEIFGENHLDAASSYNNIGSVYYEKGDYEKALENIEMALNLWSENFEENLSKIASCYNNIGSVYYKKGDYEKALDNFEMGLNFRFGVFGENHLDVASSYNNIASVYYEKGDYEDAFVNYNNSLKICLKIVGEDNLKVKFLKLKIANTQRKMEEQDKQGE